MHDTVRDAGGIVHEKLVFRARAGQLSVEAPFMNAQKRPILAIPGEALIPVQDFELKLYGDEIGVESVASELTDLRKFLLTQLVDIYNRTKKISHHRQVNTFLLKVDDPLFFEKLFEARLKKSEHNIFFKGINLENREELTIKSFLSTRQIGCRLHKNQETVNTLMPLIDFVNNHPRSPVFNSKFSKNGNLNISISRSCPIDSTHECFVSYGTKDAHDLLLFYNYVDKNTYFTRSVPTTIELPGQRRIEISSHPVQPLSKNKLADNIRDLHAYFPPIRYKDRGKKILEVYYLPIPQRVAPLAMRRILKYSISTVAPDLSESERNKIALQAEIKILRKNLRYYTDFLIFVDHYNPKPGHELILRMAREMAAIQLHNIRNYPIKTTLP